MTRLVRFTSNETGRRQTSAFGTKTQGGALDQEVNQE